MYIRGVVRKRVDRAPHGCVVGGIHKNIMDGLGQQV